MKFVYCDCRNQTMLRQQWQGLSPPVDSRVRTPPEKAARSCSKCNSRRDLLQNPIGTLVGTTAIAPKCEDVSLSENLRMGTCGVLISPSIRCRAPHCTINPDVCHEVLLLGRAGTPRELIGSSSLEQLRRGELFKRAHTDSLSIHPQDNS